ncbi:MAG: hypothetical protein AB1393_07785 [Candidatus Edwardsbacteria bacterium]
MAHAYTPGLKVLAKTKVRKERRLPLKGEVLVKKGNVVKAEDIVAHTNLPGDVQTVNVAGLLSILPEDIELCMLKKAGDYIKCNETLAQSKGFFGLFKSTCKAPVSGTIESISSITGQVILREPPHPVQIAAYLDGTVTEILEREGVVIETIGTFVQGIFGVGGETIGVLKMVTNDPSSILTPEMFTPDCKDKIIVGGSLVTSQSIAKAIEIGVKAIVVGGINDVDLKEFLGYDLGVAITGSEEKGITLVITEGFGKMTMAHKTFELLKSKEGMKASVNGATQIRAGVMRPEVIVPLDPQLSDKETMERHELGAGLVIDSPVRVIREPYFGRLGKVTALPSELQSLETEAKVRVLEVEFSADLSVEPRCEALGRSPMGETHGQESGEDRIRAIIPRANVEMIEE